MAENETQSFSLKKITWGQWIAIGCAIVTAIGSLGSALGFFIAMRSDVSAVKAIVIQLNKEVDELRTEHYKNVVLIQETRKRASMSEKTISEVNQKVKSVGNKVEVTSKILKENGISNP